MFALPQPTCKMQVFEPVCVRVCECAAACWVWDGYLRPYIRPRVAAGPCNYQVSMGHCVIFVQGEMLIWTRQQPPGWMSLALHSTGSPSLCTKDKLAYFPRTDHCNLFSPPRQIISARRARLREPKESWSDAGPLIKIHLTGPSISYRASLEL